MKSPPTKIILMTALVPTIGHKFLIDFAYNLVPIGPTHVIISARNFEPVTPHDRRRAFEDIYRYHYIKFHLHIDDNAPQEPNGPDDKEFWQYWKKVVTDRVPVREEDYFVASELYGLDMANVLGCRFMPCDIGRNVIPIKGTEVRHTLVDNFDKILPGIQEKMARHIVLFGQESTGKTTMAKALAKEYNGTFVPEWARTYLEAVGPEVTMEKMETIVYGQSALETTVRRDIAKRLLTFYDTDLLSTIGYYRLWNGSVPDSIKGRIYTYFEHHRADLYIVMCDSIPFEPDPLRYGNGKRETEKQFWIDLLKENNCNYIIAPPGNHTIQFTELCSKIDEYLHKEFKDIIEFKR